MENIFNTKLVTIRSGSTMLDAKHLMKEKRIRHLPIVNAQNKIVGMLSAHDMTDVLKFQDMPVDLFSSYPVKFVSVETSLSDVAFRMLEEKVSCLLVVEGENATGIITTDDLLLQLAQILQDKEKPSDPLNSSVLITVGEFCRKLSDVGI
jgi:acetoin utilization protein AcuB